MNKILPKLFNLLLIGSIVLSCFGVGFGMFANHQGMGAEGHEQHNGLHAICCTLLNHSEGNMTNEVAQLPVGVGASLLILIFAVFTSQFRRNDVLLKIELLSLFRHLKNRFGDVKILSYYLLLFRKGILHPKLF